MGISLQFSHYYRSQGTQLGVTDVYVSFLVIEYNMSIMAPGISLAWVREDGIKRRQTHTNRWMYRNSWDSMDFVL